MTLIAFSVDKHRAEILTDTIAYPQDVAQVGYHSKVTQLLHLDAVAMSQGSPGLAAFVDLLLPIACQQASFDALIVDMPGLLRDRWELLQARADADTDTSAGCLVVVGYSTAASRFQGWVFGSEFDFESDEWTAPFIHPAPFAHPPSRYEEVWMRRISVEDDPTAMQKTLDDWAARAPLAAPTSVNAWVNLGKLARTDRAIASAQVGLQVLVGGELHYTRLEVGKQSIRRVHTFDDEGDEFALMVAGTQHPLSLASPCLCGSGVLAGECCDSPTEANPMPRKRY